MLAFALCVVFVRCVAAAGDCDIGGTCASAPGSARSGSAMIQAKVVKSQSLPQAHKKHRVANHDPDEVDGEFLTFTARTDDVEQRITALEAKSGQGREELRTQLDALKEATAGASTTSDESKARISAAEGALSALEDVVNQNNNDLRGALDEVRSSFEDLGKKVGKQWSAMLQAWSKDDGSRGDGALIARVAGLEGRLDTLEQESGTGRLQLKNELEELANQVADISAGGAGSVEHTRSRVSATEAQVSMLASAVDEHSADTMTSVATIKSKLHAMASKVGMDLQDVAAAPAAEGSALLAHNANVIHSEDPAAPAGAAAASGGGGQDTEGLPLASRLGSVEKRAQLLEEKSGGGREELRTKMDELADTLAALREGGAKSLAHTLVRLTSLDTEIEALKVSVEQQKASGTQETASMQAMLDALSSKVGGA